jgi:hypothetical protein
MSWQYPAWTPQKSAQRGFPVWDLYYTLWGQDLGVAFPGPTDRVVLPDYHGIAIGSRSTVDRVYIDANFPQDIAKTSGPKIFPTGTDGEPVPFMQSCNIGQPLRGPILGPVVINAVNYYGTPASASPSFYLPDNGSGVQEDFVSPVAGRFEAPALHLALLQRNQDVSLLNGPRMPMQREVSVVGAAAGGEVLSREYPIFGRKGLTFQARVTAGAVTFRIGVIATLAGGGGPFNPFIESTLGTVAGVGAATPPAFIDLRGRSAYLMIYRTVTAGPATFAYNVTIGDDCCGENTAQAGGLVVP